MLCMTYTLLTLGHGYTAQRLAERVRPEGWTVIATTRNAAKAKELQRAGIEAHLWPSTPLGPLIERATHVLCSIAPAPAGDPIIAAEGAALAEARNLSWIGYCSTTAVYGDHAGAWVDENTPVTPSTQRGQLRAAAENAWRLIPGPVHIFRLAGIYGPGRGPFAKLREGRARRIIKPGQVFSRIHVDDIANVLAASMTRPNAGAIYNLCDDLPAPPEDVIAYGATLLGLPIPQEVDFETADLSPMARSFYAENKRIRNDKIKHELGVALLYPDYRAGLTAILNAESGQ